MSETKKSKPVKKERATSYVVNILFALAAVVLIANCFSLFSQVKEKKDKYNSLERLYQEELVLKSEYEYLLDEKNQLEYIERIARERYGYVAPGERAFYDSSYGK
ncbi:MAG: hypothetical protein E7558_07015 [Ruminococcaceae bacterium]|nr:hypothetical protein [Oscillospiraceae bacterium]MBQ6874008.1 septum formation initiator family protein [Clostridia bacterium]